MASKAETRLSFAASDELVEQLNRLKREQYWDKSMSQLIRDLIEAGLSAMNDD